MAGQKGKEDSERKRVMEYQREQQKVGKAYEKDKADKIHSLLPYLPGLHPFPYDQVGQWMINHAAEEGDQAEKQGNHQFVAAVGTETERLEEIQYCHDKDTVEDIVPDPKGILFVGIFPVQYRHKAKIRKKPTTSSARQRFGPWRC